MIPAPFFIHAQCQTDEPSLPTAKFDLIVTHAPVLTSSASSIEMSENDIVVIVTEPVSTKEDVDILMTNKTDMTLNLHKLSMCVCEGLSISPHQLCTLCCADVSIVLESLIFSELICREVVTIISGM